MNFREATDQLFEPVTHAELADALSVSVATIRQARLSDGARGRRAPPRDWEDAVITLAETRLRHYRKLIDSLRGRRRRTAA
jgi:hypothetical protein